MPVLQVYYGHYYLVLQSFIYMPFFPYQTKIYYEDSLSVLFVLYSSS